MSPGPLARTLRSLRRSPGFVAIATLSLGTALGLSTAVFAFMDAMTHPEAPYRKADQLYGVILRLNTKLKPSPIEVEDALRGIHGVAGLTAFRTGYTDIEGGDGVERRGVAYTRPGFFDLLGVLPRLGRLPTADEAARGDVAELSDALWRRLFHNRRSLGDAFVRIADRQFTVVGVLPNGTNIPQNIDVWIPDASLEHGLAGTPVLRLARGPADSSAVQSQLQAVFQRWTSAFAGPRERPISGRLDPLRPDPLALKDFHRAMVGAALCVLLIACANVAALMLARGMVRRRDYALRLALGARPWEIGREVIAEVSVLAVAGSVAGAFVATAAVGLITAATPEQMRWLGFVQPQWSVRVLAASALAVLVSIAVSGGFPAWRASRTDPAGPLKESGGGTTGRAGTRFRWLVMAELALAMTLVIGASLMVKSTMKLARYDFGYDARSLLRVYVSYPWRDSTPAAVRHQAFVDALARMRVLPGIHSVAAVGGCANTRRVITSDLTLANGENSYLGACAVNVSSDFFGTFGLPIVDGRDFSDGDANGDGAVILSERAARRLFPRERAVGRSVKLGPLESDLPWVRIVGIARAHERGFTMYPEMGPDTSAQLYASVPMQEGGFVIRPKPGAATRVPAALLHTFRDVLPPRAFARVLPWDSYYFDTLRQEQYLSLVFLLLGVASLALGAAGLFSVISYIASQRMREFAVRIALGAARENVVRLVLHDALVMALGGTAVGAVLGMRAGFLLWDKMWGVYPVDAGALVAAEAVLIAVTMLASLVPALRAMRADPAEVMRAM